MKESTIKVSKEMQTVATVVSRILEEIAGEPMGFALVVFTEGRASYISNCKREEVIQELKTLLSYWDAGMPDVKAHDVQG